MTYRLLVAGLAGLLSFQLAACKTVAEAEQTSYSTNTRETFKATFHEAISEKMLGHDDRAITLFEQCLVLEPGNAAVNFALSELYRKTGNAPKAIQTGTAAFESDKSNKWYALNLGQLYYAVGDAQKSAYYYGIAVTDEEQSLELKYQYAEVLISSGQYEKAIEVLNDIELETGKYPEMSVAKHDLYMALDQPELAKKEIDDLLSENPTNIEYRVSLGIYYLSLDLFQRSKELALSAIQIDPENGEGYFLLAETELRLKNTAGAFEAFKTGFSKPSVTIERKLEILWGLSALPFDPSNPDAAIAEKGMEELYKMIYDPALKNQTLHTYYGSFLRSQGKNKEALAQFKIVCDLNASDYVFWSQLLNLELELLAYEDLYTDGLKAVDIFPAQPVFYLRAATGAYESGKYDAAEEYLFLGKDLVVNNPALMAEFYIALGHMAMRKQDKDAGYAYLEQAKSADPSMAKVYGFKAKYLMLEKNYAAAAVEIEIGLKLNALDAEVLHAQGLYLIYKKDYPGALKSLEMAAVHANKNPFILENYGDALWLNNQKDRALQFWIEAQKRGNTSSTLSRKITDKTYYEN